MKARKTTPQRICDVAAGTLGTTAIIAAVAGDGPAAAIAAGGAVLAFAACVTAGAEPPSLARANIAAKVRTLADDYDTRPLQFGAFQARHPATITDDSPSVLLRAVADEIDGGAGKPPAEAVADFRRARISQLERELGIGGDDRA